VRALFRSAGDIPAFTEALRKAFPADPPAVSVLVVPSDLPVPAARVALDAVVLVEG